jgi:pyrroline-5-carboxylate reductase
VCEGLAASWTESKQEKLPIIVSICAGIPMDALATWFTVGEGRVPKIVRVMPNTPALLGEGASGSFAGAGVTEDEKNLVTALLEGFSKVSEWVEKEELIDVVTALSGMFQVYVVVLLYHSRSL